MSDPQHPIMPQRPEPAFNAPWPAVALLAALAVAFAAQTLLFGKALPLALAFSPAALAEGRLASLVTSQFLHTGWLHVGFSVVGALAFGSPVARYLGEGARGATLFFIFFLACGVLGSLTYAAFHRYDSYPVLGASSGVAALMAASSRLLERRGRLAPIFSRMPMSMAAAWLVINLIFAIFSLAPGAGAVRLFWEAHLAAFFAGLLLIAPFGWLAGVEDRPER
jgi:membrane associated rhomboid family serine protease